MSSSKGTSEMKNSGTGNLKIRLKETAFSSTEEDCSKLGSDKGEGSDLSALC